MKNVEYNVEASIAVDVHKLGLKEALLMIKSGLYVGISDDILKYVANVSWHQQGSDSVTLIEKGWVCNWSELINQLFTNVDFFSLFQSNQTTQRLLFVITDKSAGQ